MRDDGDGTRQIAAARRLFADLTDGEYRMLEDVAYARGVSVETAASDLLGERIVEEARRASGMTRMSASVSDFRKALRRRDGASS